MPIGFDEIQVQKAPVGTIISLKFKEKLDRKDYEMFVPMIESQMKNNAPIRIIVELIEFKGWTAGALWKDTKFSARHYKDIEKLAIVGDKKWEKGINVFFKPFAGTAVRYFEPQAIDQAWEWIKV